MSRNGKISANSQLTPNSDSGRGSGGSVRLGLGYILTALADVRESMGSMCSDMGLYSERSSESPHTLLLKPIGVTVRHFLCFSSLRSIMICVF